MHLITSTKQFAILQRHPQQRRPQQQHSTLQPSLDFVDGVVGRLPYQPDDGSGGAVVFGAAGGVVMVSSVVFSVIVSVTVSFTVGLRWFSSWFL
jgi:hypothetical protein